MLQDNIKEVVLMQDKMVSLRDIVQFKRDGFSTVLRNGVFIAWR